MKPAFLDSTLVSFPPPGPWAELGGCKGADPSLFFPMPGHTPTRVERDERSAICAGCPVLSECTAYAIEWPDLCGFWAGMTEGERRGRRATWRRQRVSA